MKPNGLLLYKGKSMFDGKPIIAVAVQLARKSKNEKTGNMVQTYILRSDVSPTNAVRLGEDASVCGECTHRGNGDGSGRTCYVTVFQGPLQVFHAYQRGMYPAATMAEIKQAGDGRVVRLGTYGDPAAVPAKVWNALISKSEAHTGYTQRWRTADDFKSICMASVATEQDALEARAAGWRTFRVATPDQKPKMKTESTCPASSEAGKILTCVECKACNGANGRKGSIVIQPHGGFAVMSNFRKTIQLQLIS